MVAPPTPRGLAGADPHEGREQSGRHRARLGEEALPLPGGQECGLPVRAGAVGGQSAPGSGGVRPRLGNLDLFTRSQLLHGDWAEFEGNHFHPDEWPRYRHTGDAYLLDPRKIVLERDVWRFVVVDPATESKKTADYTAMLVLGVIPGGDLLLLDVLRKQLDVGDIVPTLADLCRRWGPSFVGMESVAFQRLLVLEAAKNPHIPPIHELKPAGKGKLARAVAAIVKAERKEIHLPHDEPWLDDFVTELAGFTGSGDQHDDQVDCLAYAVTAAGIFTGPDESESAASDGFELGWNGRYAGDDYAAPRGGFDASRW